MTACCHLPTRSVKIGALLFPPGVSHMASVPVSLLDRQVRKVRRRLFLQSCLNRLIVAWVSACAVMAVWLLMEVTFTGLVGMVLPNSPPTTPTVRPMVRVLTLVRSLFR